MTAAIGAIMLFGTFVALGTWQVQRRAWKLDLISRVEQRVHAPVVGAPERRQWSQVTAAADEYRHVQVTGTFLDGSETLVQATTDLGPGFWLLTPVRLPGGDIVLVNRGFVSPEWGEIAARASRAVQAALAAEAGGDATPVITVAGLLRMTEPGGGFLRRNDPVADHWYSRDVQGIAKARRLKNVAPYFIDEDGGASAADGGPVGGLTVITFRNNHLEYAITWYVLALMVVGGAWIAYREQRAPRLRAGLR